MRFYVDTSVWGGYYDSTFSELTKPFIDEAINGRFTIILSDVTLRELEFAPEGVKNLPTFIPSENLELVTITDEQLNLANLYIQEGALSSKFHADAQHIAIASSLKAESLISWNFRHMVNFFQIRQFNAVNLKFEYSMIDIRTPREITYVN